MKMVCEFDSEVLDMRVNKNNNLLYVETKDGKRYVVYSDGRKEQIMTVPLQQPMQQSSLKAHASRVLNKTAMQQGDNKAVESHATNSLEKDPDLLHNET